MENDVEYREKTGQAVDFLRRQSDFQPEIILVLGTGLGSLADECENARIIPCAEIPHFPVSTVEGHAGNLVFGKLAGKKVAVLQGRYHYYEGYSTRRITFPIRVMGLLGAKSMIITNAAGGLDTAFTPGSIMVIADHINFIPENPLRGTNFADWGPRFPDMSSAYDRQYMAAALECAGEPGIGNIVSGVYGAIAGPSLETPAETRYLRNCGIDAVGMSTVPEVIVARHCGLRVLGLSILANINDPGNFQPILLEDVIAEVEKAADRLKMLILKLVADVF